MVPRWQLRALLALICASSSARAEDPPPADAAPASPPAPPVEVTRPVPLSTPAPLYPEGARGDHVVIVELTVTLEGTASDLVVISGDPPFAERALEACRTWTFRPAERGGKPVPSRLRFEVRFTEPPPPPAEAPPAKAPAPVAPSSKPSAEPEEPIDIEVLGVRREAERTSLTRAEVRELPGTFGDPFRAIEVMPGVTPIATGVPYFYVRGSPPGNVGYFLDGIRVPLLYHFALGPSVIHPGLVERVDLYPGGYPARFGRFSGGIVAAETTPPRAEFHGEANLRLFDAGAMVEAPFAGGRATALVGGRYSYTAGILSLVAPEVTLGYWDYQLRLGYDASGRDQLGLFAFGSYDFFSVETADDDEGLSTEFHRVDLRHRRRVDARTAISTAATVGIERTGNETLSGDEVDVIGRMVGVRSSVEHRASEQALLRTGADIEANDYSAELPNDDAETRRAIPSRVDWTLGAWGDVVLEPEPGFTLTPGLRVDGYHSDGRTALGIDPRLSARFQVTKRLAIEHAFGIAHQTPSFVVPIPGFALGGLRGGLQRAVQTSSGVDVELGNGFQTEATVFQNAIFNLSDLLSIVRQENIVDDATFDTRVTGHTYGLELMLRRSLTEKVGGYFAYTLSRSERLLEGQEFIASFDRSHVLHAALAWDLGRRWRAGARFTFYTGLPPELDNDPYFTTDPATGDDVLVSDPVREELRSPAFYRLDLRLEKKWMIGKSGAWWSFIVEVLNSTLHRETLDWRCRADGCRGEEFGPVTIPSIGLEAAF